MLQQLAAPSQINPVMASSMVHRGMPSVRSLFRKNAIGHTKYILDYLSEVWDEDVSSDEEFVLSYNIHPETFFENSSSDLVFSLAPTREHVGMSVGLEGARLRLSLLGPFSLTDSGGRSFAPKAQKERALLALLALAPQGERSRAWLRDKLWSDRGDEQAGASLRQALVRLRKCLAQWGNGLIRTDRHTVSLDLSMIVVDARLLEEGGVAPAGNRPSSLVGPPPEFLEGLDVADPEFEDWLRAERRRWTVFFEERAKETITARASVELAVAPGPSDVAVANGQDVESAANAARLGVGLLPSIVHGTIPEITDLADIVAESVARSAEELLSLDIYDYREAGRSLPDLDGRRGADYLIRVRLLQVGSDVTLTLFVYRASVTKLQWSQSIQASIEELFTDGRLALSGFVNQNVDRLASMIVSSSSGPSSLGYQAMLAKTTYLALNSMYRLSEHATLETDRLLMAAAQERPDSLFGALLAYNNSFRIGEYLGVFDDEHRRQALGFADDAEAMAPFNSITLACLGHVRGFVLGDHERAGELLAHAVELNPLQAFAWDHYALHKIYVGDYAAAVRAARRAVHLGSYNPLRYTFETTLCMGATLAGDFRTAIHFGRRALSRQPRFAAAMRYLVASYHAAGRHEDARSTLGQLAALSSDFSQASLAHNGLGLVDREARARLLSAFVANGLKKG